jgi:hypothetical protein
MLAGLFWLDGVERGASETPISSASTIVPRSFVSFAPRASGLGQACRGASRPRVGHPHDGSVFQESSAGLALRPVQNVLNDPFHVRGLVRLRLRLLVALVLIAFLRAILRRGPVIQDRGGTPCTLTVPPDLTAARPPWTCGAAAGSARRGPPPSARSTAEQATEPLQHDGPVEPVERMSVGRLERNHLADEFGEDEAMFKGFWTVTASSLATSAASSPWRPVPRSLPIGPSPQKRLPTPA